MQGKCYSNSNQKMVIRVPIPRANVDVLKVVNAPISTMNHFDHSCFSSFNYVPSNEFSTCYICYNNVDNSNVWECKCGKYTHLECIVKSIRSSEKSRCPFCRIHVDIDSVFVRFDCGNDCEYRESGVSDECGCYGYVEDGCDGCFKFFSREEFKNHTHECECREFKYGCSKCLKFFSREEFVKHKYVNRCPGR